MSKKVPVEPGKSTREKVFDFLVAYKSAHNGDSPSNRDIAHACSLSISTVNYHLLKLEVEDRIQVMGRRRIHIVGGTWALPVDAAGLDDNEGDGDNITPSDSGGNSRFDREKDDDDSRAVQRKESTGTAPSQDSSTPPHL